MEEESRNVSFLDLHRALGDSILFTREDVLYIDLIAAGDSKMGQRLREYVKAPHVCCKDVIRLERLRMKAGRGKTQ